MGMAGSNRAAALCALLLPYLALTWSEPRHQKPLSHHSRCLAGEREVQEGEQGEREGRERGEEGKTRGERGERETDGKKQGGNNTIYMYVTHKVGMLL